MQLAEGFERYQDSNFAHEAGYDALMTGVCYFILEIRGYDLNSLINKIPAFRSFYSFNFAGDDDYDYDGFWYLKGPDVKKKFAGTNEFKYRFIKDTECFVKGETEELFNVLREESQKNEWTLEPASAYFQGKASP